MKNHQKDPKAQKVPKVPKAQNPCPRIYLDICIIRAGVAKATPIARNSSDERSAGDYSPLPLAREAAEQITKNPSHPGKTMKNLKPIKKPLKQGKL